MKNKSAFLRKLVLYGFVYDVDYSHIPEMNALLENIGSNLLNFSFSIIFI